MDNIKFGSDGWRSVIADGFTVGNVARVSRAISRWLVNQKGRSSVIIGYDTRFGGEMFAQTVAKIFALTGIKVYLSDRFITTPMVSLGVVHKKASLGVVITASHYPYHYNGLKLKGPYGGPLLDSDIKNIENMVPEVNEIHLDSLHFDEYVEKGNIEFINLEDIYLKRVLKVFDMDAIRNAGLSFAFDAMHGTGCHVMKKLLPDIHFLHCQQDFSFGGLTPEPVDHNLRELTSFIRRNGRIDSGMAVDGDADRLALYDGYGNFVDPHNILLLLVHYLHKYKGCAGEVVAGFSSTSRLDKLCRYYNLKLRRVKTGIRDICAMMLKEDVLVGGEESGGIAVCSHIPDRDGIWNGLLVWQFMAETGKSLRQLIDEVHSITGPFVFERADLSLEKNRKNVVLEKCKNGYFRQFGSRNVEKMETLDGFKFIFNEDEWLMIRASGTEPVLRTYAESSSAESTRQILQDAHDMIMTVKGR